MKEDAGRHSGELLWRRMARRPPVHFWAEPPTSLLDPICRLPYDEGNHKFVLLIFTISLRVHVPSMSLVIDVTDAGNIV